MNKDTEEERVLDEMQALIKFCEVTDNQELRMTVKQRLTLLSGIPKDNEWSIHNLEEIEVTEKVIDHSSNFTEVQLFMFKDYFKNTDLTNEQLSIRHSMNESTVNYWMQKFFRYSSKERNLMLLKLNLSTII